MEERMNVENMLQYCNEALAWEELGPVDVLFFETVKRIILGEIPAQEEDIFDEDGYFNEEASESFYYVENEEETTTIKNDIDVDEKTVF